VIGWPSSRGGFVCAGVFARLARLWDTPRLSGLIRGQGLRGRSVDDDCE